MNRTSRLRESLRQSLEGILRRGTTCETSTAGYARRIAQARPTSRPARHRFDARLDARACRGRGSASELVVEVGSPSSTRIELSAWRPLRQSCAFSRTCTVSPSRDDLRSLGRPWGKIQSVAMTCCAARRAVRIRPKPSAEIMTSSERAPRQVDYNRIRYRADQIRIVKKPDIQSRARSRNRPQ